MTDFWKLEPAAIAELRAADFSVRQRIPTRWRDNDAYGHVNNAVYYEYFDTAINSWLLEVLPESRSRAETRKFVAESRCRFLKELAYPEPITVGVTVARLGASSVTYDLAIFGSDDRIAAIGRWVHVFVGEHTRRPTPIPDHFRAIYAAAAAPVHHLEEA